MLLTTTPQQRTWREGWGCSTRPAERPAVYIVARKQNEVGRNVYMLLTKPFKHLLGPGVLTLWDTLWDLYMCVCVCLSGEEFARGCVYGEIRGGRSESSGSRCPFQNNRVSGDLVWW